jgi:hypothetical protein
LSTTPRDRFPPGLKRHRAHQCISAADHLAERHRHPRGAINYLPPVGSLLPSRLQPESASIRPQDRPPAICPWPHERLPADGGAAGWAVAGVSHRPWAGSFWHAASPARCSGTTTPPSMHRSAPAAARPEHSPRVRSEADVVGRLRSGERDAASTARSRHWSGRGPHGRCSHDRT